MKLKFVNFKKELQFIDCTETAIYKRKDNSLERVVFVHKPIMYLGRTPQDAYLAKILDDGSNIEEYTLCTLFVYDNILSIETELKSDSEYVLYKIEVDNTDYIFELGLDIGADICYAYIKNDILFR